MAEQFANGRKISKPRLWFKNLEPQFANERKCYEKGLWFESIFMRVWQTPVKTDDKAENHSKECPINTTVGESWGWDGSLHQLQTGVIDEYFFILL